MKQGRVPFFDLWKGSKSINLRIQCHCNTVCFMERTHRLIGTKCSGVLCTKWDLTLCWKFEEFRFSTENVINKILSILRVGLNSAQSLQELFLLYRFQ